MNRTDCRHAAAITKSDVGGFDAIGFVYVGGDGNVTVLTEGGETVAFVGMSAGDILPVLCKRVNSTGTTATNMVVMW